MDKPLKPKPKKAYSHPTLTVYGTVSELRQRAGKDQDGACRR